MAKVTINGKTYTGNNISITNGRVAIDGVFQDDSVSGVVEVRILEGILNTIITDTSVTCGDVQGDVTAYGSVKCRNVGGNVDAGGSVVCGNVSGKLDAGGSVVVNR